MSSLLWWGLSESGVKHHRPQTSICLTVATLVGADLVYGV